jgi:hypothetical protein
MPETNRLPRKTAKDAPQSAESDSTEGRRPIEQKAPNQAKSQANSTLMDAYNAYLRCTD